VSASKTTLPTSFIEVDEIDFLPADVHVRRVRQHARRWRWAVAAAFVVLTLVGLAGNRVQHARLASARDRLKPQANAVAALDVQMAALRQEIELLGLQADLRGALRLQPATTVLVAAVTTALPDRVALTELRVTDDRSAAASLPPVPPEKASATPPARLDLERLGAERRVARRIVTVRGLAPDDAAVSDYLEALRHSGPFTDVRLLFTDRHERRGNELRSFSLELRVRDPGSPPARVVTDAATATGGASRR
jgi:hypothetical protein